MVVNRFDVFLVNLDPTIGSEIKKTRPCLIISPNEINHHIATVIVAPMTTKGQTYPTRVTCQFQGQDGQIVLDQIRTVDKTRLVKLLGQITTEEQKTVLDILAEMFAE
ncbi:MAG: type II toxin-antitoxin system PemK/MazF family toxin [Aphanizomenon gracile PMC649.10]|uniref:type II toxin-antitoxin system PemK/MazF family toxin n=1 Tax=Dolichospermum sp. LEGE 00240 TaxID=1828603 RepID=UPI001D157239|nr:type II toxin-antitoxin system PemK/MazF family toxin [Dolichospermum sp. LEGE 00240]MDM3848056.1 type II toxin-antitoxin system PemK/MazF family toxin [Aphanizomenon gracile PMC638.10]MDM3857795.1 type II toxin-antitoxin system PemK/MazF family toxin [Aphanizomenon gracile PMC649.10]MDM3860692.1 type II toxin-antitoxin system PemK/MazF family toxin [Aphanizomenon gracile PMC644.10]